MDDKTVDDKNEAKLKNKKIKTEKLGFPKGQEGQRHVGRDEKKGPSGPPSRVTRVRLKNCNRNIAWGIKSGSRNIGSNIRPAKSRGEKVGRGRP